MNTIFYLILILGTNGSPTSQSSTPIGDASECMQAGIKARKEMPDRYVQFICVKGIMK